VEQNTVTPSDDEYRALFSDAGARSCPRCGKLASLATDNGGATPGRSGVWFCFECGHEEPSSSDVFATR